MKKGVDIHKQGMLLDKKRGRLDVLGGDKKVVEKFLVQAGVEGISDARIIKYINTLIPLKRLCDKDFRDLDEDDIKELVLRINGCELKDATKRDYRLILKKFLRHLKKEPAWLKGGATPKSSKIPEEVLVEEDIKELVNAAYSSRDRAFIMALYESDCRIGEFLPIKIKYLSFDDNGILLRVDGKTGPRRVRLVISEVSLKRWLEDHPCKNDPDSFIWCKDPTKYNPKWTNNNISYGFVRRLLKQIALKADVKKSVNPHAFRHARATFMANHLKEPQMREFFGWESGSDTPSIYVHLSGRDIDDSVLSIYGRDESKKRQEPTLKVSDCPRCSESNDSTSLFCFKCGFSFTEGGPDAHSTFQEIVVELLRGVAESDSSIKDRFREIVREKGAEGLFNRSESFLE